MKQFHVNTWKSGECLPEMCSMLDLIDSIDMWVKRGNQGTVVVHCM